MATKKKVDEFIEQYGYESYGMPGSFEVSRDAIRSMKKDSLVRGIVERIFKAEDETGNRMRDIMVMEAEHAELIAKRKKHLEEMYAMELAAARKYTDLSIERMRQEERRKREEHEFRKAAARHYRKSLSEHRKKAEEKAKDKVNERRSQQLTNGTEEVSDRPAE